MENFKVGETVMVKDKASVDSLTLYKQFKMKYSFLICPCNVKRTDRLVVKYVIGNKGLLLHYEGRENVVTMMVTKDVKKVHSPL